MKIKQYFVLRLFFLLLLILLPYFGLLFFNIISVEKEKAAFFSLSLIFVAFLGAIIVFPEIGKKEEGFIVRFLIMTTFQLLFMMAVLLYETYSFTNDIKQAVLHQLTLFVLYVVFQSVLLARTQRKQ